ncbi:uncharacterized protein LOC134280581 [Saccostrea cucullata]|uniref:uncharacterized protein LOC134280581 n=1 Tax=Saccostrea cuccullata TaxID=36930 RepID=UPI002ED58481
MQAADTSEATTIKVTEVPNGTVIETTKTPNATVIETTEASNAIVIETTEAPNATLIETTGTFNGTVIETTKTPNGTTLETTKVTSTVSTETAKAVSALVSSDASTTGTFLNSGESCLCSCDYFDKVKFWSNENNLLKQFKDLEIKLTEIRNQLVVNVRNLSSNVRLRVSAPDERKSSAVMGTLGIIIMSFVFGVIIISDFPIFFQHIRTILRKLKKHERFPGSKK